MAPELVALWPSVLVGDEFVLGATKVFVIASVHANQRRG